MENNIIYAFKNKSTATIDYIGKTINLKNRIKAHKFCCKNSNIYLYAEIRNAGGFDAYEVVILENGFDNSIASERERYWYNFYKPKFNANVPNSCNVSNDSICGEKNNKRIGKYTEKQLQYMKKWRAENRERANQASYNWKKSNPDKQREYAKNCTKRSYDYKISVSYDYFAKQLLKCLRD